MPQCLGIFLVRSKYVYKCLSFIVLAMCLRGLKEIVCARKSIPIKYGTITCERMKETKIATAYSNCMQTDQKSDNKTETTMTPKQFTRRSSGYFDYYCCWFFLLSVSVCMSLSLVRECHNFAILGHVSQFIMQWNCAIFFLSARLSCM